jgi:hypothetical protein
MPSRSTRLQPPSAASAERRSDRNRTSAWFDRRFWGERWCLFRWKKIRFRVSHFEKDSFSRLGSRPSPPTWGVHVGGRDSKTEGNRERWSAVRKSPPSSGPHGHKGHAHPRHAPRLGSCARRPGAGRDVRRGRQCSARRAAAGAGDARPRLLPAAQHPLSSTSTLLRAPAAARVNRGTNARAWLHPQACACERMQASDCARHGRCCCLWLLMRGGVRACARVHGYTHGSIHAHIDAPRLRLPATPPLPAPRACACAPG